MLNHVGLAEIGQRFKGAYCQHHQGNNGSSNHLSNVGKFLRDCRLIMTEDSQSPSIKSFNAIVNTKIMNGVCV
jgi:hypothetical protein